MASTLFKPLGRQIKSGIENFTGRRGQITNMKNITLYPVFLLTSLTAFGQSPSLLITWPPNNSTLVDIASAQGTVTGGTGKVTVGFSIDGGPYSPTIGGSPNWFTSIYASYLSVGVHNLNFLATDSIGKTSLASTSVKVFHASASCLHSMVGAGIYCEQTAASLGTAPVSLVLQNGYGAGNLIVVGVQANDPNVPWVTGDIYDTAGNTWVLWGNVGSGYLDENLVQVAIYYTFVKSAIVVPDMIVVNNPGSSFTVEDAVVYSGVGSIDGAGGSAIGRGGMGVFAATGSYSVTPGDLNIGFNSGAPTIPGSGWTERLQDYTRPYTMFIDQIAPTGTADATWTMNIEGYLSIGLAFKPIGSCTIQ
jgi:hypothetical protein